MLSAIKNTRAMAGDLRDRTSVDVRGGIST
jgi:hypothetical protein